MLLDGIHKYLLDEVSHFHLRSLLRHVGLHLRVRVIDDGQEHVLHRKTLNRFSCVLRDTLRKR